MNAEVFALVCAVESLPVENLARGSWTTGQDTGSDQDD
jgi:hypothetical protein